MHILTKVFIVLLVIFSMLTTAGFIVFVNRQEVFRTQNEDLKKQAAAARSEAATARDVAQTTKADADRLVSAANAQVQAAFTQVEAANRQALDQKGEIAKAKAETAAALATAQGAQAAIQAAQSNVGVLQAQLLEVRKAYDENQRKITDHVLAISDLSNKNQVLERQLRNALEDITALKEDAATAGGRAATAPAGGAMNDALPASDGGVPINGVIRATKTIAGVKYATISIGSADAVRKGMQFHVLGGRNGSQFLGYVKVTNVEPHEAIGQLSGPRVNEVTTENEVRSRL